MNETFRNPLASVRSVATGTANLKVPSDLSGGNVSFVVIEEDQSRGQLIWSWVLEGRRATEDWHQRASGESIGHKRIVDCRKTSTSSMRREELTFLGQKNRVRQDQADPTSTITVSQRVPNPAPCDGTGLIEVRFNVTSSSNQTNATAVVRGITLYGSPTPTPTPTPTPDTGGIDWPMVCGVAVLLVAMAGFMHWNTKASQTNGDGSGNYQRLQEEPKRGNS